MICFESMICFEKITRETFILLKLIYKLYLSLHVINMFVLLSQKNKNKTKAKMTLEGRPHMKNETLTRMVRSTTLSIVPARHLASMLSIRRVEDNEDFLVPTPLQLQLKGIFFLDLI